MMTHPATSERLRRVRAAAAWNLRLEQAYPALLPALVGILGAAIAAELALPQKLPFWLHLALLLLLLVFVCIRAATAFLRSPRPEMAAIDRRIERNSRWPHHPLLTLSDRPAGDPDPGQSALWQAHLARTLASLSAARAGRPRLDLRRHWAGRLAMLLAGLFVVSCLVAGQNAVPRLASGFLPGLYELAGPVPWMQAWITPPDYARTAPVFLADPNAEPTVPFGSVLQVTLTSMQGAPRINAQASGRRMEGFTRLSPGSWSLRQTLRADLVLALRGNGHALASWHIHVTPLPPAALDWNGAPGTASGEISRTFLPWRISTPYGASALHASIRLAAPQHRVVLPDLQVAIPLPADSREAHGAAMPDLSSDPRAGEAVIASLHATDLHGRAMQGPDARFVLPARPFRNPLARALIDTRKRLALGLETRSEAQADLEALGDAPGQFAADTSLFLNLSSIASLLHDPDRSDASAAGEAVDRLWELALGLEDALHNDHAGARAVADLRSARDAVNAQLDRMRALGEKGQNAAEQSELERRIQALSRAIARRMQALAEQARREHTLLPPMPDAKMLSGQDLGRMMQQMRDEAARGKTADAMQRLSQMQAMLDRMRAATPQDLQQAEQQEAARAQIHEQMQGLQDLTRRQAGLLDQTQARRSQRLREQHAAMPPPLDPQTAELLQRLGITPSDAAPPDATNDPSSDQKAEGPPKPPQSDTEDASARAAQQQQAQRVQHSLSRALDELGLEFKTLSGKQPGGLSEAGEAMDAARQALSKDQDEAAEQQQQKALADLQKGAGQMQQALSSSPGSGSGFLVPGQSDGSNDASSGDQGAGDQGDDEDGQEGQGQGGGLHDPLGRPIANGAHGDDGQTHVPDKAEQMRARDIETELRRRDTDRTRPTDELDYLDRLLKSF